MSTPSTVSARGPAAIRHGADAMRSRGGGDPAHASGLDALINTDILTPRADAGFGGGAGGGGNGGGVKKKGFIVRRFFGVAEKGANGRGGGGPGALGRGDDAPSTALANANLKAREPPVPRGANHQGNAGGSQHSSVSGSMREGWGRRSMDPSNSGSSRLGRSGHGAARASRAYAVASGGNVA